jgi:hypothetical protein
MKPSLRDMIKLWKIIIILHDERKATVIQVCAMNSDRCL